MPATCTCTPHLTLLLQRLIVILFVKNDSNVTSIIYVLVKYVCCHCLVSSSLQIFFPILATISVMLGLVIQLRQDHDTLCYTFFELLIFQKIQDKGESIVRNEEKT